MLWNFCLIGNNCLGPGRWLEELENMFFIVQFLASYTLVWPYPQNWIFLPHLIYCQSSLQIRVILVLTVSIVSLQDLVYVVIGDPGFCWYRSTNEFWKVLYICQLSMYFWSSIYCKAQGLELSRVIWRELSAQLDCDPRKLSDLDRFCSSHTAVLFVWSGHSL